MDAIKLTQDNLDSVGGIPLDISAQVREAVLDGDDVHLYVSPLASNPTIKSTVVAFGSAARAAWQTNGNSVWGDLVLVDGRLLVQLDDDGGTVTLDGAVVP